MPASAAPTSKPAAKDIRLKLVILTGQDTPSTCSAVSMLAQLGDVQILEILFESQPASFARRLRSLRRNIRREGLSYLYFRLGEFIQEFCEKLAAGLGSRAEVAHLLRQAFPGHAFSLSDVTELHGIPVFKALNLNDAATADRLRKLGADLGVVIGTRILKRSTFAVPRMGCINLHKGKVPEYRGLPPGFWELYEGQDKAGVTVHFVDDGLDTGDVLGEDLFPIHPKDSPTTLARKLDQRGNELLVRCVQDLAKDQCQRRSQPPSTLKARTSPTRRQRRQLDERLGLSSQRQSPWVHVLKTFCYLATYYSGVFHLLRFARRITRTHRACILLYHRVNDMADDPLTTNIERFSEHLVALRKWYTVIPTSRLIENVRPGGVLPANAVAIHFDDCYRDVFTQASPMLAVMKFPACSFVSSGFVGTDRTFPHDSGTSPFVMENLTEEEVRGLFARGFEVGAHTVNHADLGQCDYQEAAREVRQSKQDLERLLARPVKVFSYPFGKKKNIRAEVVDVVRQAGYDALFSAYGGYVSCRSDLFNLPRVGVTSNTRPLDLLMEIEGVSLGAWRVRLMAALSKGG